MVELDSEDFEVQALANDDAESDAMFEVEAQEYVVSTYASPLASVPINPRTEDMAEEEEVPVATHYSIPPTTPTPTIPPNPQYPP